MGARPGSEGHVIDSAEISRKVIGDAKEEKARIRAVKKEGNHRKVESRQGVKTTFSPTFSLFADDS